MAPKMRIIQTNGEQLVVKSPSEEFVAEAQKALNTQKGVLIFEKNGWVHHLSASHIIRLELSQEHDDQEDEADD